MQHELWYSSETPDEELGYPISNAEDNVSQENISDESEMLYFLGESSEFEGREQSGCRKKPVSVKQTLAHTNKILFGPLLETSAEKKDRLKKEVEGIEEDDYRRKKRHRTKREKNPMMKLQPLVYNKENSHFVGIFPGDKTSTLSAGVPKVKIELHPDSCDLSQNVDTHMVSHIAKKKTVKFKKQTKYVTSERTTDRTIVYVSPKPQKIIVTSWVNTEEQQNFSVSSNFRKSSYQEEHSKNELNTLESVTESAFRESEKNDGICNVDPASESSISNPKENDTLFISVDNSKFPDVPTSFDLNMIRNFPLFSHMTPVSYPSLFDQSPVKEEIVSIGAFDDGYQKLPSVRKILDETMPSANKIALEKWKAKMIKELGEEGFHQYRKGLLDRGLLLHSCIHSQLSGVTPSIESMPTLGGLWTSIKHVLPDVSNVSVLESRLIHPYLYYKGALDCVGFYRGMPMLIEWKTSSKPKLSLKSMFDDPLQVVAYLGALNFDSSYKLPHHVESAMLVVAYDTGLPAHIHILKKEQCEHYWNIWCSRLAQFWEQLQL